MVTLERRSFTNYILISKCYDFKKSFPIKFCYAVYLQICRELVAGVARDHVVFVPFG